MICLIFSRPVAGRGRLGRGGRNWCYRKPSIGAKAIKSCRPHHKKTEAFFPGSRLYAVILKRRKSDMKSLRHVGLHENFVIGAIGADSGFMKLSSMSFFCCRILRAGDTTLSLEFVLGP